MNQFINKVGEIHITEQQLFDYMNCPTLFDIRNSSQITIPYQVTQHKLICQVMRYFLTNLQNGVIPTYKELQRKWDSICAENKDIIDANKNISGWQKIVNFVTWAQNNKIAVGDISIPFIIDSKDVVLHGSIDQLLVDPQSHKIELFYPNFTDKEFDKYTIDTRLKYTIDAYAFKTIYKQPIDGIHVYSAKTNQNTYTYRGEEDFLRLKTSIYNIGHAIVNNCFYPRENALCSSCPGKVYCKYWHKEI